MHAVRERALGVLERVDLSPGGDRLNAGGFVWEMLVQHEHQHNETMLQTLQLAEPGVYAPERPATPGPAPDGPASVHVPAGRFLMGDSGEGFAYDNELPCHDLELRGYSLDRTPVTNGEFARFVEDGGYRTPKAWSRDGWAW